MRHSQISDVDGIPHQTDVLYVLGNGSNWNNNEIRFSLRSIEQNLSGYRNIFISGAETPFLQNVINIPCEDPFPPQLNADGNIIYKILKACQDSRISENFLFINDDHLFLKPLEADQMPPFHKGEMLNFPPDYWTVNPWRKRLFLTMHALQTLGATTFHYDCHTPILINKKAFQEIMQQFDYSIGIGLTMKSLYGNCIHGTSGILLQDEKTAVFNPLSKQELQTKLQKSGFLSFNDYGLNPALISYLNDNFPEQSSYEIYPIQDRIIEINTWLNSERNFDQGVEIFKKYFHGANLIKLFEEGETPTLRAKLEYKFKTSLDEN